MEHWRSNIYPHQLSVEGDLDNVEILQNMLDHEEPEVQIIEPQEPEAPAPGPVEPHQPQLPQWVDDFESNQNFYQLQLAFVKCTNQKIIVIFSDMTE